MIKIHKSTLVIIIIMMLFSYPFLTKASNKDTIHVVSHKKVLVKTNPAKGYDTFTKWCVFPKSDIRYRKVILTATLQCPDSLHCGEWDYVDHIYLRRQGGVNKDSKDIEIARTISPYGYRFPADWSFSWDVDVTDFSSLLRDSVEIEFNHSGYESNKDRGWLITLDFAVIEGTPAMEALSVQKLWEGNFPFGDTVMSINEHLLPIKFKVPTNANVARLRILQTGHGMDHTEDCAEFCAKTRKIFLDNNLKDEKKIWKSCGDNPLYPQAGTWIYNRAGWCPGSMVVPDQYDFNVKAGEEHTLKLEMQEYRNPTNSTADYVINAYLIFYKDNSLENDVVIDEIMSPSTADFWNRINPICYNPVVKVTNKGKNIVTSIKFKHGIHEEAMKVYLWNGNLETGKQTTIVLKGELPALSKTGTYTVEAVKVNGKDDAYPKDNKLSSVYKTVPVYDTTLVLYLRTNNDTVQTSYFLANANGDTLYSRKVNNLKINTFYADTFRLKQGCYTLKVEDAGGDGLDFWANPEGGYGYVRLADGKGKLIKAFNSDFGNDIIHQFRVQAGASLAYEDVTPIVNIFPIRNPGIFKMDIFMNDVKDIEIAIINPDKAIVFELKTKNFKSGMLPFDLTHLPDATYTITVKAGDKTITRKMKIKKD